MCADCRPGDEDGQQTSYQRTPSEDQQSKRHCTENIESDKIQEGSHNDDDMALDGQPTIPIDPGLRERSQELLFQRLEDTKNVRVDHWKRMIVMNRNACKSGGPASVPPSALRTLRLCAYFTSGTPLAVSTWSWYDIKLSQKAPVDLDDPGLRIAHCLAATKPYAVPLECLSVRHVFQDSDQRNPRQWWNLLNACIVGLCYDGDEVNDCDKQVLSSSQSPPPYCVGLGIVRAIDWKREILFLLTPIGSKQLSRVHILLVGGQLELPLQCTFRGVRSEAFPYHSHQPNNRKKQNPLVGSEPMKSRNTLMHHPHRPPQPQY